jgi:hypothetical protein
LRHFLAEREIGREGGARFFECLGEIGEVPFVRERQRLADILAELVGLRLCLVEPVVEPVLAAGGGDVRQPLLDLDDVDLDVLDQRDELDVLRHLAVGNRADLAEVLRNAPLEIEIGTEGNQEKHAEKRDRTGNLRLDRHCRHLSEIRARFIPNTD